MGSTSILDEAHTTNSRRVESKTRGVYRNFWDGFAEVTDNTAMMLNKNAEKLERFDRGDILASLPDYSGMHVADIGAGIGYIGFLKMKNDVKEYFEEYY